MNRDYQKAIDSQSLESQSQNDDLADFMTFPWAVESHRDTEGGYIIREARHEHLSWCYDRQGRGEINRKPIRFYRPPNVNHFVLAEVRLAA